MKTNFNANVLFIIIVWICDRELAITSLGKHETMCSKGIIKEKWQFILVTTGTDDKGMTSSHPGSTQSTTCQVFLSWH